MKKGSPRPDVETAAAADFSDPPGLLLVVQEDSLARLVQALWAQFLFPKDKRRSP